MEASAGCECVLSVVWCGVVVVSGHDRTGVC